MIPKSSNTIDSTNNTIITVSAVIYQNIGNETKFLLVQENDDQYGLAGGAKDIEDLDTDATLKRELEEELSLLPIDYKFTKTEVSIEFVYNHKSSTRFGKKGITIYYIVEIFKMERIKASSELKGFAWLNKDEAMDKLAFEEVKEGFRRTVESII